MENVLWQALNLPILSSLESVFIWCGTNNVFADAPMGIVDCTANIGFCLWDKWFATERWELVRKQGLIKNINRSLEYICLKHDFSFTEHSNDWSAPNDDLDPSLFFRDIFSSLKRKMSNSPNWSLDPKH